MTDKKKKELSDLQKSFLVYLFEEETLGNVRAAMDKAGYSRNTAESEVVNSLTDEIIDLSHKKLATSSIEAVFSLISGMRNGEGLGAANRLKAAQAILDRAGVAKKTEDNTIKAPVNAVLILPPKGASVKDISVSLSDLSDLSDQPNEGQEDE